ncbi:hypothetical protein Pryu01_02637 [Paraliobacillus ryukyuensis]|uniref:Acetyltransferase (GNAT) family protein n=1 Tax=Paraliobacillus ryukyuensis TaxID=200904 RepID=A0A366DZ40_9BACI|nr:GNAT family N-acetyltransferase [Paraliobacillus ryukyuensis]RBO95307.1 acetyltransferase (GNAT) family protein [Paraliobacillus ryukyuensis]
MHQTRWASVDELNIIIDYWIYMANEMSEIDNIPKPDRQKIENTRNLFIRETKKGNLNFRVAVDQKDQIIACTGGLIRQEYAFPLAEEQTTFGWIIAVYTLKPYRNNGLAHRLVEEVCTWLKENGAHRARLWSSSKGIQIYESLGFHSMIDLAKTLH